MVTFKKCLDCNGLYSICNFTKDVSKKDGKNIYCKNCCRRKLRQRNMSEEYKKKRNKSRYKYKDAERGYMLKTRYGITLEEFNQIFESQGKTCPICKRDKSCGKNFVVDHSHKTGKNRGILCNRCNVGLGSFKDSIELLQEAINYLTQTE